MRPLSSTSLTALLAPAFLSLVLPSAAMAQSGGDPRALDALGPGHGARHTPAHSHRAMHHAGTEHAVAAAAAPAGKPIAARSPPIPAAPPPAPVFKAPVIDVPLHPEPPPPPVPVVASATGAAGRLGDGSRITFGAGSADLNPATMAALRAFAVQLKAEPEARAEIDAYAAGTADDPSTPRRMSLSRGLAARAVLINAGVPSTRIYVRAIGQPSDTGPADRVDLTRPEAVQPVSGQPVSGQPVSGQPVSGQPVSAQPVPIPSVSDHPASGPSTKAVTPP